MTRLPRPTADDVASAMIVAIILTPMIFGCNQWSVLAMFALGFVGVTAIATRRQTTPGMWRQRNGR